jgi:outer membrane lipoprotein
MKWLPLSMCLLLNACSNLPPAIENAPAFDASYGQVIQNIDHYKTAPVRWGGVIVGVENEQNYTLLQVLSYPLNYYGRPQLNQPNQGRFLVRSTDFLDPAVYAKDKEMTVAGTVGGDVSRTIGNKVMRLPLISAAIIYLWPDYQRDYYYGGYGGFGLGYPIGYPYYWGQYYHHR